MRITRAVDAKLKDRPETVLTNQLWL